MDEALRQYQLDLLRAQLSRRRFMTLAAFGGAGAFLAACGGSSATTAPSEAASSAPSSAPSGEPSTAEASAAATPAPSY